MPLPKHKCLRARGIDDGCQLKRDYGYTAERLYLVAVPAPMVRGLKSIIRALGARRLLVN